MFAQLFFHSQRNLISLLTRKQKLFGRIVLSLQLETFLIKSQEPLRRYFATTTHTCQPFLSDAVNLNAAAVSLNSAVDPAGFGPDGRRGGISSGWGEFMLMRVDTRRSLRDRANLHYKVLPFELCTLHWCVDKLGCAQVSSFTEKVSWNWPIC